MARTDLPFFVAVGSDHCKCRRNLEIGDVKNMFGPPHSVWRVPLEERERIRKAKRLRAVSRGYKALKKDKAEFYEAAARALEEVERRSKRPVATKPK